MKTLFSFSTHSNINVDPDYRIKKFMFLNKRFIDKFPLTVVCYNYGYDNVPKYLNKINSPYDIKEEVVNIFVTGQYSPKRILDLHNGKLPIIPGYCLAIIKSLEHAKSLNYDKVIYSEFDLQILNDGVFDKILNLKNGVFVNRSELYQFPDVGLQVITKEHFDIYIDQYKKHMTLSDKELIDMCGLYENFTPLTDWLNLKGDRYGDVCLPEELDFTYDYISQLNDDVYYKRQDNSFVKSKIEDVNSFIQ